MSCIQSTAFVILICSTMQRNPIKYWRFCEWKQFVHSTTSLLETGSCAWHEKQLMLHDGPYVADSIFPWRSLYPNHKPPHETLGHHNKKWTTSLRWCWYPAGCQRNTRFMITQVIRTSCNAFSQVFVGHLEGLCVKYVLSYSWAFFPMPHDPVYEDTVFRQPPERRLLNLNFTDDIMCREEAVRS